MPLEPRHTEIPRDQVDGWIAAWNTNSQGKTLGEFITQQITDLRLTDEYVHTYGDGMDQWAENATHIADIILADLPSYGVTTELAVEESEDVHVASSESEGA